MRPGQYALLAAAAESMYADGVLNPILPADVAANWEVVDYITGRDALFLLQGIGLGDTVFYGALLRSLTDPREHVVLLRGTETAAEWMIDCEAMPLMQWGHGYCVHSGFWSIYASLQYKGHPAALTIANSLSSTDSIAVVGHSLGAALATYLMIDLHFSVRTGQVSGHIFASPKPGDGNFAAMVKALPGLVYTVYNYSRDLVPHAPPTLFPLFDYHQLANVVRITPATAQAAVKSDPGCSHSALSYAAMLGETVQSTCLIGSSP